jgi:DNA-binding winged helix-turn-helix (wHTH) protein
MQNTKVGNIIRTLRQECNMSRNCLRTNGRSYQFNQTVSRVGFKCAYPKRGHEMLI